MLKKKLFKCEICNVSLSAKSVLDRHVASVHEGKKSSMCNICDKEFTSSANMKRHIEFVHEGKKTFSCEICQLKNADKLSTSDEHHRFHTTSLDVVQQTTIAFAFHAWPSKRRGVGPMSLILTQNARHATNVGFPATKRRQSRLWFWQDLYSFCETHSLCLNFLNF